MPHAVIPMFSSSECDFYLPNSFKKKDIFETLGVLSKLSDRDENEVGPNKLLQ